MVILMSRGFTPKQIAEDFEEMDVMKFLAAYPAIMESEANIHALGVGKAFGGK